MNFRVCFRRAISICLGIAILSVYSMQSLASTGKISGELTVSGRTANGDAAYALVNGEAAKSGRSIFSSSTISTPENITAAVNVGKIGSIELAPMSAAVVTFSEKGISTSLTSGSLTAHGASVDVNLLDGTTLKLDPGETATTAGKAKAQTTGGGGSAWVIWAVVIGGAVAGILIAATLSDNNSDVGGGGTVVSPVR